MLCPWEQSEGKLSNECLFYDTKCLQVEREAESSSTVHGEMLLSTLNSWALAGNCSLTVSAELPHSLSSGWLSAQCNGGSFLLLFFLWKKPLKGTLLCPGLSIRHFSWLLGWGSPASFLWMLIRHTWFSQLYHLDVWSAPFDIYI